MRQFYPLELDDMDSFKRKLLQLSKNFSPVCFLESNNYPNYPYTTFGNLIALDAVEVFNSELDALNGLQNFIDAQQDWLFGYISYDLKNEIEPELTSQNADGIQAPLVHFFVPRYLLKIEKDKVEIGVKNQKAVEDFKKLLLSTVDGRQSTVLPASNLSKRISKEEYLLSVEKLKQHILRGDIYEINFCQEWYAENTIIDPVQVFEKLNAISKAPFTSYFKSGDWHLLCASPERFLKKQKNKLISQPIKGTRRRGADSQADQYLRTELLQEEKERSENVMIVDLVRNDLSRIAEKHSVQVEELFGIYTFEQVHQMISTITATIPDSVSFTDILRAVFPMGSMTGAPKVSAMQLIEKYEKTKRGIFSGTVGYITPKGNFDFNVVIRSILYNASNQYVSVQTGSAVTYDCDAEQEYEECLLKAQAMLKALQ